MKTAVEELAILGGVPAFSEVLHVGRPNVGNSEALFKRFEGILERRWFTNNGPVVQEFEKRVAEFAGVEHCIAMCNATIALEIVVRALGLTGEVLVPSFTFVATAHALQWQEITPVFCDIDPKTHAIDPRGIERMITPRTTGVIGVHVWGVPCDVEALTEICRARGLRLVFDAAHAFATTYQGRMVGGFGNAEVYSFHATKFFNTFEGGAVVTNDGDLAARIRLMKNFGFAGYDRVVYIGTNGKMSEVSAAMGLTSFESMDDFITVNRRNYSSYRRELSGIPGIAMLTFDGPERRNFQYVVLEVNEDQAGIGRDALMDVLWSENVIARRYFYPGCHRMEPYRSYYPHAGLLLPQTESVASRVLLLPTGTAMDDARIVELCALIRLAVAHAPRIRAQPKGGPARAAEADASEGERV